MILTKFSVKSCTFLEPEKFLIAHFKKALSILLDKVINRLFCKHSTNLFVKSSQAKVYSGTSANYTLDKARFVDKIALSKSLTVNTHLLFIKIGKQMDRCRIHIVYIANNKNCAVIRISREKYVCEDEEVTTKDENAWT